MSDAPATASERSPGQGAGSAVRSPGRPRSAEADMAIVEATLAVLVEDGYRALSVEKVRERAGVGKATIYRRYASKEELVKAAVQHLHSDLDVPEDTGSVRGDYAKVVESVGAAAQVTGALTLMPRVLAEVAGNPEMTAIFKANLVDPRRRVLEAILKRAIARGEVREDIDLELAVDLIAGPMIYRIIITGGDLDKISKWPMRVLDAALEGISPR